MTEWIKFSERKPEEDGHYLVCGACDGPFVEVSNYDAEKGSFVFYDSDIDEIVEDPYPMYWAEIPDLPDELQFDEEDD